MVQQGSQCHIDPAQQGYMGMGMHHKAIIHRDRDNNKCPQQDTEQGSQQKVAEGYRNMGFGGDQRIIGVMG